MRLRFRAAAASLAIVSIVAAGAVSPSYGQSRIQISSSSVSGAYLASRAAALRQDIVAQARFLRIVYLGERGNLGLASTILSLLVETGDIDGAIPYAVDVVEQDPGFEPARLTLAVAAFAQGDHEAARGHVEAITGDEFSDIQVSLLSAWAAAGTGDFESAIAALTTDRTDPAGIYHAALIADIAGDTDRAIALVESVYDPELATPRMADAYARLLARAGDTANATIVLETFLAEAPDTPQIIALRDEIAGGGAISAPVGTVSEGVAEVLFDLGGVLAASQEYEAAIAYLQLAAYLGPAADASTVRLGQLLQVVERHEDAALVLGSLEPDSPFYVAAATSAAISETIDGRPEDGIARLAPVVAEHPGDRDAASTLADIYRSEDLLEEADAVLSALIETMTTVDEDDWTLFFGRGVVRERMDRWEEAEADFRRALILEPDQPDVLNYLGYSWLIRDENYLEALELIERAVAQRPDAGYIIDSLGWAYFKLGDYDAAVETLERALEMAPDNAEVYEHLGDAYWRAGREVEAGYQWRQALLYGPDEEQEARILDKIENGLPAADDGIVEIN